MAVNHKKGIAFAILTAVLWGFLAIIIKVVLKEVSSITIVWVRMTIAFLGVGGFYLLNQPSVFKIFIRPPNLLWVAAPALALNYIGYSLGVEFAGPAAAQVVIQLGATTLCLSGFFLFKEHFSKRQILGFVLAFCGLFLFYRRQMGAMETGREDYVKGILFLIMGALTWAAYGIAQKKLVVKHSVQHINLFLYAFASLAYLPFVNFSEFQGLGLTMILLLLFLGLNTLVAYGAVGAALKYTDAGKVSVIIILNPLITFAALGVMEALKVDWIVLDKIPFWAYIGAGMMLTGAVLATAKGNKKTREEQKIDAQNTQAND